MHKYAKSPSLRTLACKERKDGKDVITLRPKRDDNKVPLRRLLGSFHTTKSLLLHVKDLFGSVEI